MPLNTHNQAAHHETRTAVFTLLLVALLAIAAYAVHSYHPMRGGNAMLNGETASIPAISSPRR